MRKHFVVFFILCFISCKDQPLSYTMQDEEDQIISEVWKLGDGLSFYTDIIITDSYYMFTDYENESLLHVYAKDNPSEPLVNKINDTGLISVEFVKSNTRYPTESNSIWIIDNKSRLKQVKCEGDSLRIISDIPLPRQLNRSADYNIAKEELYGVISTGKNNNAFYFFHSDSGYYWVDMYSMDKKKYRKNNFAYFPNLVVNERTHSIACAYRFFNKVQFFDLRGNIIRDISYGNEAVEPKDNPIRASNFMENMKCFINIYGTEKYVYCVYDGSYAYTNLSKIIIFTWDGSHVKTLQTDRMIKKIAVDPSDAYILALVDNNGGGRDVVRYNLLKIK